MSDFGKPAIPGHDITVVPSPLGQKYNSIENCFSSGPVFDLTPKDESTQHCLDTLPSPYGPPYGKEKL